ncbi:TetR/AcrR family transcriptional regulator [Herbiconiux sp. VKM Ac-1786]|uniref:TetR/AcrR family transcriptional regulator n=1 Tax=Herbiconiux sp. VKM Ac-1786 TaxID=2783824 RepID=UPI00188D9573|nr:TetR/AcrR family transcriptional regulator [Herbiconiux sp. VKM Ac-1786]MBF4571912.1 TetR/AcrR family transcriptional regulator [Herbiconiux sp. VKM Ac-1786]
MTDIPARRPKTTRPHGDARRRQILNSAMELFSARGFNGVSLAEVADHAGLTQPGLLHHFRSKASLLLAVLQEREQRNNTEEQRLLDSGYDYFQAFLSTLARNEKNAPLVQLFAVISAESLSTSHPGHSWTLNRYRDTIRKATTTLDPLLDPEKLPDGVTAETIARWLIGMADGLRIQWILEPATLSRHALMTQFVDILRPFLKS